MTKTSLLGIDGNILLCHYCWAEEPCVTLHDVMVGKRDELGNSFLIKVFMSLIESQLKSVVMGSGWLLLSLDKVWHYMEAVLKCSRINIF